MNSLTSSITIIHLDHHSATSERVITSGGSKMEKERERREMNKKREQEAYEESGFVLSLTSSIDK